MKDRLMRGAYRFMIFSVLSGYFNQGAIAQSKLKPVKRFELQLKTDNGGQQDTATLVYWTDYISALMNTTKAPTGPVSQPFYFSIRTPDKKIAAFINIYDPLIGIGGGHLLAVVKKDGRLHFTGAGAAFYNCQLAIRYAAANLLDTWQNVPRADFEEKTFLSYFKAQLAFIESQKSVQLAILEGYQSQFSADLFGRLKTDVIGKAGLDRYDTYSTFWREITSKTKSAVTQQVFRDSLNKWFDGQQQAVLFHMPDSIKAESKDYSAFLIAKEKLDHKRHGKVSVYNAIKANYKSILRDKLLTLYLTENFNRDLPNADSLLNDAIAIVQTKLYVEVLNELQARSSIGKPAYNFRLPDVNGKLHSLSGFKGKMVLLDFWFTGCSACTQLYREVLKPVEEAFTNDPGVVFISISSDRDKLMWQRSIEGGKYTAGTGINLYTNGQGIDHEVIAKYDAGLAPTLVLIDKKGNISSASAGELGKIESLTKMLKVK